MIGVHREMSRCNMIPDLLFPIGQHRQRADLRLFSVVSHEAETDPPMRVALLNASAVLPFLVASARARVVSVLPEQSKLWNQTTASSARTQPHTIRDDPASAKNRFGLLRSSSSYIEPV